MQIEKRDLSLLTTLARYGILSSEQIWTRFFQGIAKTTMLRRLRILENGELIRRVPGLPHAESAWVSTRNGYRILGRKDVPPKFGNQNAIVQDVRLSGARMTLEHLGLAEMFTPEWELKRRFATNDIKASRERQIPDGFFVAKCGNEFKSVALELELTTKAWGRYRKIAAEYAKKSKISFVWYLTAEERTSRLLIPIWKEAQDRTEGPELLITNLGALSGEKGKAMLRRSRSPDCPIDALFTLKPFDHAPSHGVSTPSADLVSREEEKKSA